MLERYTWMHNSVLNSIVTIIQSIISQKWTIYADLPGLFQGNSTTPHDILITKLKPDIVLVNEDDQEIIIVELTIPFEINIIDAHSRKVDKYSDTVQAIESNNFKVKFFAIEVGSRGYINKK